MQRSEKEMILSILENSKVPLKAKFISKSIYEKFNGYKIGRYKVRDILWDNEGLKPLVFYCKEDYTYTLKTNIKWIKDKINSEYEGFMIKVNSLLEDKNMNRIYDYSINGDQLTINCYLDPSNFNNIIKALVLTELHSMRDPSIKRAINYFKKNLINIL